ncbi:MAG: succinylglutamate desuccinylase/aspartoacylase family protein [Bacteriovoracaceae bacterium]|nr:succinylglutamate desuccinylase/aspartoacylase family protein [Bacteriovoracaceae bacterium]
MKSILEIQTIEVHKLPSGESLNVKAYIFDSGLEGPTTYIQSSVHGAELQGNIVIYEMMKHIKNHDFKGKITFVPLANPFATNNRLGGHTQGRFNPITGHNWNRNYTDLMGLKEDQKNFSMKNFVTKFIDSPWEEIKKEYKIAIEKMIQSFENKMTYERGPQHNKFLNLKLQSMASDADFVLDLHTGPIATRYIYSAEYERDRVKDLSFPFNLSIPNKFAGAMDEACFMPWVELSKSFKSQGREIPIEFESYTVELGSEELINTQQGVIDSSRLLHFLYLRGQLVDDVRYSPPSGQYLSLLDDYKTYYSSDGGLFEYHLAPGDTFKKGDILGEYLLLQHIDEDFNEDKVRPKLVAVKDGIVINHCTTCSIGLGNELYQVMENYQELT